MTSDGTALHTVERGDHGPRVVFLHGLFGQGRNWTTIGKALTPDHRVTLVDLPHHGRSPWSDRFDYPTIADQVAALLDPSDPAAVVGHSMGGKVAMLLALLHPDLVERLVVADMSPVRYDTSGGLADYAHELAALDLDRIDSREDAEEQLASAVPEPTIRAFLLQNLRRDATAPSGWRWQPNLAVLERDMPLIADWPEDRLAGVAPYDGPVLWLGGGRSNYVREEYAEAMDRWFPRNRKVVMKQAGHWLHSEQPDVFTEVLRRFLAD